MMPTMSKAFGQMVITMWAASNGDNRLYAFNLATKARDNSDKDFTSIESSPGQMWSDGTYMWIAFHNASKFYAYDLHTKQRVSSEDFSLDSDNNESIRSLD